MDFFDHTLSSLKKKRGVIDFITLCQIPGVIFSDYKVMYAGIASLGICGALYGYHLQKKAYDRKKHYYETRSTSEYDECVQLYDEYVKDIAKMFKELGYKPDLLTCAMYLKCLDNGYFSESDSYKYIVYEDEKDNDFFDILGARISTGTGCCRHSSSLLVDIINEMGGKATSLTVLAKVANGLGLSSKHMLAAIVHNNQKVAIETTMGDEDFAKYGVVLFEKNIGKCINISREIKYKRTKSFYDYIDEKKEALTQIDSYPSFINEQEILMLQEKVDNDFQLYKSNFESFKRDESVKIKKLAKLSEKVLSHSLIIKEE